MSDSSSQDKWGDLARVLGAEVREEHEESPAESEITAKRPAPAPRTPAAPPKRPSSGWDQLGSEFGLPTPPEEQRELPAEDTPAPAERQKEETPRRPKPARPAARQREESDREKPRSSDRAEESRSREDRRRPPKEERPRTREKSAIEGEKTGEVVELHSQQTPPPVRSKPDPPPIEPPRSGYGLPDWFPFARKRETPPPPPAAIEPPAPAYEEMQVKEEVYEVEGTEAVEEEVARGPEREQEEDDSRKGKRRRPRRRRRGGKTKDEAAEKPRPKSSTSVESIVVDLGPAGHDVELFEDDEEEADVADPDSDFDDETDEEESGSSRPASHRSIPSWGDAIGVVVDANLATRSERKKSARPAGNGQGGRSRGRRKKRS